MARTVKAPTGSDLTCKNWLIEGAYRMIQNNLDAEVAFDPDNLIVYGGRGKAARNWEAFDAILDSLRELNEDETLLVQSGKPVGVFRSHTDAPRVLIANTNIVPHWATQEQFDQYERDGLMMYGQMTAGSWIYIGTQGILQGTYETFGSLARQHGWGDLSGKLVLTAGLGEMGGAQAQAITFNGAVLLTVHKDHPTDGDIEAVIVTDRYLVDLQRPAVIVGLRRNLPDLKKGSIRVKLLDAQGIVRNVYTTVTVYGDRGRVIE